LRLLRRGHCLSLSQWQVRARRFVSRGRGTTKESAASAEIEVDGDTLFVRYSIQPWAMTIDWTHDIFELHVHDLVKSEFAPNTAFDSGVRQPAAPIAVRPKMTDQIDGTQPAAPGTQQQALPTTTPASPASNVTSPEVIAEREAAAPRQGAPNPYDSEVARSWKAQLVAAMLRNKRYPEEAPSCGEQGVVHIFFSLDRQGRLLDSRLVQSSGVDSLDEEALALLRRGEPYPPPPPEWRASAWISRCRYVSIFPWKNCSLLSNRSRTIAQAPLFKRAAVRALI
jgi:TonB family protein